MSDDACDPLSSLDGPPDFSGYGHSCVAIRTVIHPPDDDPVVKQSPPLVDLLGRQPRPAQRRLSRLRPIPA